jgi:hypothetical protein
VALDIKSLDLSGLTQDELIALAAKVSVAKKPKGAKRPKFMHGSPEYRAWVNGDRLKQDAAVAQAQADADAKAKAAALAQAQPPTK